MAKKPIDVKALKHKDTKEKANTMGAYWVPGVNNLGRFGRWAFAEYTAVYEIEAELGKLIESLSAEGVAA